MERICSKPASLKRVNNSFCPGCMHGMVCKLVAETIDKFGSEKNNRNTTHRLRNMSMDYFNFDMVVSAHGRAPAVATGYKRCRPDNIVFTYQGDGDLAAIGFSEIMHCANRGENITTVFVNNSIYGMTGGQMAPTTLIGQRATTCPEGRDASKTGYPMRMAELIADLEAPVYVARFALNTAANVLKAKSGLEKAFRNQMEGKGYSFVELLSNCPTNWGLSPEESLKWITEKTIPYFPLGEFKGK